MPANRHEFSGLGMARRPARTQFRNLRLTAPQSGGADCLARNVAGRSDRLLHGAGAGGDHAARAKVVMCRAGWGIER